MGRLVVAYLKDLAVTCATCSKRAAKELIDRWNGSCGRFCSDCAKVRLREALAREKK